MAIRLCRLLEVRWGELLGKAKRGAPRAEEKVSADTLSNADKQQRKTLRKLAENKPLVLAAFPALDALGDQFRQLEADDDEGGES